MPDSRLRGNDGKNKENDGEERKSRRKKREGSKRNDGKVHSRHSH